MPMWWPSKAPRPGLVDSRLPHLGGRGAPKGCKREPLNPLRETNTVRLYTDGANANGVAANTYYVSRPGMRDMFGSRQDRYMGVPKEPVC